MMLKDDRIYVAGHRGLVGSALLNCLRREGYQKILTATRAELDLSNGVEVDAWFQENKPDYVLLAAAKVGGIHANDAYPADFIRENLQIQTNVIDAAYRQGVKRLLFLGSSCIYPKFASQPIVESALLQGALEPTNEWYAIAKIAGVKMCQAYYKQYGFEAMSVMPTNLFGPNDNFDLKTSHVLPALIRKFHEAKASQESTVSLWGSGSPRREFLHVDELADACVHLMNGDYQEQPINIGTGRDISIAELASLIADVVGFEGEIYWDRSMPDGTPRKLLDVSFLTSLGWVSKLGFRAAVETTYAWYVQSLEDQGEAGSKPV